LQILNIAPDAKELKAASYQQQKKHKQTESVGADHA